MVIQKDLIEKGALQMIVHAYDEMYLNSIQSKIGDAFDFSINFLKIPGEKFIQLFMCSGFSKMIE